jgi:hypothetical protein
MRITKRDVEALLSIARYRFLTPSQIERLHFPNLKKAQLRLKFLFESGLVGRVAQPSPIIQGKSEFVYFLKKKSLEALECLNGSFSGSQSNLIIPSHIPRAINHFLDINSAGIAFEVSAARTADSACPIKCHFIPEYLKEVSERDGRLRKAIDAHSFNGKKLPDENRIKPDFVMALDKGEGRKLLFFGEIDRGTESILSASADKYCLKRKIGAYVACFDNGHYKAYEKNFGAAFNGFRVLFITTTEERLRNVLDALTSFDDVAFFWLTTLDKLDGDVLTSRIWRTASPGEKLQAIIKTDGQTDGLIGDSSHQSHPDIKTRKPSNEGRETGFPGLLHHPE